MEKMARLRGFDAGLAWGCLADMEQVRALRVARPQDAGKMERAASRYRLGYIMSKTVPFACGMECEGLYPSEINNCGDWYRDYTLYETRSGILYLREQEIYTGTMHRSRAPVWYRIG